MRYIWFIFGSFFWIAFAYDIEYDRDFITWMWLFGSLFFFVNSYVRYKHDMNLKNLKTMNNFNLLEYFERLRHDENHHLGLGDVRLTLAQQEEIIELIEQKYNDDELYYELASCEKCHQMINHLNGRCQKCNKYPDK